MAPRVVLTE